MIYFGSEIHGKSVAFDRQRQGVEEFWQRPDLTYFLKKQIQAIKMAIGNNHPYLPHAG
jgi:hypothetical protein